MILQSHFSDILIHISGKVRDILYILKTMLIIVWNRLGKFGRNLQNPAKVKNVSGSRLQVKDSPKVAVPSLEQSFASLMTSYGHSYKFIDKL